MIPIYYVLFIICMSKIESGIIIDIIINQFHEENYYNIEKKYNNKEGHYITFLLNLVYSTNTSFMILMQ